ncbi:MAG: BRCT domain-containing protein [Treponema sp.]|jgi:hypothetical protein|nr:BRCT domain-containing protein [Treponema sp.]
MKIIEPEDVKKYTGTMEADKAFHTLDGILKGINIDNNINLTEINQLNNWCNEHINYSAISPFLEVITLLQLILEDGVVTQEEYEDLSWLCNNITTPNRYYDAVTSDMQRLQGLLHGILSDGKIEKEELEGLKIWINSHSELISYYPYDEIKALLYNVLEDGLVTDDEQKMLKVYFSQFADIKNMAINTDELEILKHSITIPAICTMNPNITFKNKLFCVTGISSKGKRKEIVDKINSLGGSYNKNVIKGTDYLIIADNNNPCWVFSCYGRKIERAVEDRKAGLPIQIIKEVDFWNEVYKYN